MIAASCYSLSRTNLAGFSDNGWSNVGDDDTFSVRRIAELEGPFSVSMGKALWSFIDDTRDCLSKPKAGFCHFLLKQWIHVVSLHFL